MNAPAPEPKPKRSRRMVVWMVVMPIVVLLLALAGANWKRFHLLYVRGLIHSEDPIDHEKGFKALRRVHLEKGMPRARVAEILSAVGLIIVSRGGMSEHSPVEAASAWYKDPKPARDRWFLFQVWLRFEKGRLVYLTLCY